MPNTIQATGEAMPKTPSADQMAAWEQCREYGKLLSKALADSGFNNFAFIRPAGTEFPVCFGSGELSETVEKSMELPVDKVDRLSLELSMALDEWNDQTNTSFAAHVPPASSGRGYYFENLNRDRELPRGSEAVAQLGKLLNEVGRIIRNEPDLKIDRITVNEHGIHTFHKVPGLRRVDGEAV